MRFYCASASCGVNNEGGVFWHGLEKALGALAGFSRKT